MKKDISPRRTTSLRKGRKLLLGAGVCATLALVAVEGAWLALPQTTLYPSDISWSRVVFDKQGELLEAETAKDDRYRLRTKISDISQAMKEAAVAYEDKRFYNHGGIDFASFARAAVGYLTGKRAGGASTLTMQVARRRFHLDTRSPIGKIEQMIRALQLEKYYSKDDILEAWFNLAPFGGNIEGIETVARIRCGKNASQITRAEALLLAIQPQSPETRLPHRLPPPNSRESNAKLRLFERMSTHGGWRNDELLLHFCLPQKPVIPHRAPHFCRLARGAVNNETIHTTLDGALQNRLETALRNHTEFKGDYSILIVHAPSREVRVWIGSPDFENSARAGQVDGNLAQRSPGSLLKPFLYAQAMDAGMIIPDSLLSDVPSVYSDWTPENYRKLFRGPVRAKDALMNSLNMPAVNLLQRLGIEGLYNMLRCADIPLHPPDTYGLTLALGAAETTPLEIAKLYTALADDGLLRPIRFLQDSPREEGRSLGLSPEARWLALDMIYDSQRHCSFKTGTSQNYRDAWVAAVHGEYVSIIHTGDFKGGTEGRYVGSESALPLLDFCLSVLHLPEKSVPPPPDVRTVELCALSGALPNPDCPHRCSGYYIAGVSSLHTCTLHQSFTTKENKDKSPIRKVRVVWSAELAEHFRRAGLATSQGDHVSIVAPPHILSPIVGRHYMTTDSTGTPNALSFRAVSSCESGNLFWFIGNRFLGKTKSGESLDATVEAGDYDVTVMDEAGGSDTVQISISSPFENDTHP